MPDVRDSFKLEVVGAVTTGVKDRQVMTQNGQITSVDAYLGTQATGAAFIFDVRKNGTTILAAPVTIPVSTSAATAVPVDSTLGKFAVDDVIDVNVTQVGSTVAGSDLDVSLAYVGN